MCEPSPTLGDVIRRFGSALRQQLGAAMTRAQDAVLTALERCRTAALGGHLYRGDHCSSEHPAYNSCRDRHCPSCLGHKSAQWLEARAKEWLPVPYFHVVFTMPEQVSALALGNKRTIYGILFRAAAQTLLHHPHLHCVVPGGGLSPDGSRWIPCREGFFLPVEVLSALFRGKFLALLDEAARRGKLRFGGSTAPLAEPAAWGAFLAKMHHEAWVVYAKPPFGSPEQVFKYLACYTHRVAISNRRIVAVTDEQVTFRYRDRKRDNVTRTMTLGGVEFLRRFLLHVLPKGFVRIRHFGLFANRTRKAKLAQCRALLGAQAPAIVHPPPTPRSMRLARAVVVRAAGLDDSAGFDASRPRSSAPDPADRKHHRTPHERSLPPPESRCTSGHDAADGLVRPGAAHGPTTPATHARRRGPSSLRDPPSRPASPIAASPGPSSDTNGHCCRD